jgi:thiol-disulfide isomerase/thioredoxin
MSGELGGTGDRGAATASAPGTGWNPVRSIIHRLTDDTAALPVEGRLPQFDGATGWLNSEPLTPEGLRGRVVLVDFWTYTCINWLRTLPYRRAWAEKYADLGVTVIGVHTPEFGFEQDVDNVVANARTFGVEYPIALDPDYGVWRAFANRYWPALYVADVEGRIRYHHFGEGEYVMSEMVVQQLLLEAGRDDVDLDLVSVQPEGFEVAADWTTLRSPETYLSFGRSAGFASSEPPRFDEPHSYQEPARPLSLNQWAPTGTWTLAAHAAVLNEAPGRIGFRFQARDVNLVMGPPERGASLPFRVLLDGAAPGAAAGFDVDAEGNGALDGQRLYQLIRVPGTVGERLVEIEFLAPGAEAYCFTFG